MNRLIILPDQYDDISLLAPRLDIGMRLGNFLHWIDSVDDRLYLSRLDELPDVIQNFSCHTREREYDLLAARPRRP